jgi:MFS family permease
MSDTFSVRATAPVLAVLAAATLTASMGVSIATVLLPELAHVFSATIPGVQWVVLAYLVAVTVTIVSAGRLGDLFGHRRVLVAGLAVFAASSALCAVAPALEVLVAARALQGIGGAILIALPMSIARDRIGRERLGLAMGLLGTMSATGTALGPSLGGVLLAWGDWRAAFWLLAVFALVNLAGALGCLGRGAGGGRGSLREMDLPGTVLLVIALGAYALATGGGMTGFPIGAPVLVPGALVALALFVLVELRAAAPLVPMHLLADRRTGAGFAMNLLVGTVMMSTLVVAPFYLALALGLDTVVIGLVMSVGPVVAALSGIPAGRLTDRFGSARVMTLGLVQAIAGLLCLAFLPRVLGVTGHVLALVMLTPAFQLFLAANNTAVLMDAPGEQRGRLSGLLGLSRNLGFMTGASAMPAVFVAFLGRGNEAGAPAEAVAHAFSMTFVLAAGLAAVTLGLALAGNAGRRSRSC